MDNPNRTRRLPDAAGARLLDRRGSHRLEHAGPLRPPDQRDAHLGGPLAARVRAAVSHRRQSCRRLESVSGRNRPRPDRGRHADQRVRQRERQHGPRRAGPGSTGGTATNASARRATDDRAGFKFGDEALGSQALCPPQLAYPSFFGQASTESQGPWDSNYQVEDDFSWFVPGKKGDHDLKFGARYNYTELRRVSQINAERHVHDSTAICRSTRPTRAPIPNG